MIGDQIDVTGFGEKGPRYMTIGLKEVAEHGMAAAAAMFELSRSLEAVTEYPETSLENFIVSPEIPDTP